MIFNLSNKDNKDSGSRQNNEHGHPNLDAKDVDRNLVKVIYSYEKMYV